MGWYVSYVYEFCLQVQFMEVCKLFWEITAEKIVPINIVVDLQEYILEARVYKSKIKSYDGPTVCRFCQASLTLIWDLPF